MPIAVVIPTLDAAAGLARTLAALAAARGSGLVTEVVVADGGSRDGTADVARAWGARVVVGPPGRGAQLAAGTVATDAAFLLFLHADTILEPGWAEAAGAWLARPGSAGRAAYFRLRLDDDHPAARRLERIVAWRARRLGLPYGDQGLLIGRDFLAALGGWRPLPLMEDVDLVRRIGRRRLDGLPAAAVTSAVRYRRDGYLLRPARNLVCLGLYFAGLPPAAIRRLYG
ncbi:glycosyl transferase [Allostella vacuolata]|nr:glycosyl transferase [Stella vacuolata]